MHTLGTLDHLKPHASILTLYHGMCDGLHIFVMCLNLLTYLHHHGYEEKVPWYRGKVNIMQIASW